MADNNFLSGLASATPSLLGGAISAAGSVWSQSWQNKFNREEAEKQRVWNEAQIDKQNAFNLEMWNKTNAYNDPAAQVQRLRDAGLNPLYYGLDGSSASGVESASPLGYDRASMSGVDNPVSSGMDAAVKVAQISNIQADTAKKNNENLTETQKREKMQAEIEEIRQEISNKIASEKLTDKQRERLQKDLDWLDRLNEATVAEKQASADLSLSQKKRIEALLDGEKIIQSKTIEDFEHKWSKISAEISKIAGENKILAKDLENYALNHASNGFMGTGLSLQNLFRAFGNRNQSGTDTPYGNLDVNELIQSGQ